MSNDPHGYRQLHEALRSLQQRLEQLGSCRSAERIGKAADFYGVASPSEYLGESRIALEEVLKAEQGLPEYVQCEIRGIRDDIDIGFRNAGNE